MCVVFGIGLCVLQTNRCEMDFFPFDLSQTLMHYIHSMNAENWLNCLDRICSKSTYLMKFVKHNGTHWIWMQLIFTFPTDYWLFTQFLIFVSSKFSLVLLIVFRPIFAIFNVNYLFLIFCFVSIVCDEWNWWFGPIQRKIKKKKNLQFFS